MPRRVFLSAELFDIEHAFSKKFVSTLLTALKTLATARWGFLVLIAATKPAVERWRRMAPSAPAPWTLSPATGEPHAGRLFKKRSPHDRRSHAYSLWA